MPWVLTSVLELLSSHLLEEVHVIGLFVDRIRDRVEVWILRGLGR